MPLVVCKETSFVIYTSSTTEHLTPIFKLVLLFSFSRSLPELFHAQRYYYGRLLFDNFSRSFVFILPFIFIPHIRWESRGKFYLDISNAAALVKWGWWLGHFPRLRFNGDIICVDQRRTTSRSTYELYLWRFVGCRKLEVCVRHNSAMQRGARDLGNAIQIFLRQYSEWIEVGDREVNSLASVHMVMASIPSHSLYSELRRQLRTSFNNTGLVRSLHALSIPRSYLDVWYSSNLPLVIPEDHIEGSAIQKALRL
ncbi:P0 [Sauropus yellowing virus]|uniref:p0 n=1 Tax=Sauropus yellowing virus TaxID=1577997 RepID=A0A0A7E968_9VIRU|nr:P0 [Sauropus yellowing virus]AIY62167.1 P0 [Sauropus yellowing virus]